MEDRKINKQFLLPKTGNSICEYPGNSIYQSHGNSICNNPGNSIYYSHKEDPINIGVKRYYQAGFSSYMKCLTIVDYENPENGEKFKFFTSLPLQFKPGLIAWLYFKRWNIEKGFDVLKNELNEKKAWAKGMEALKTQSYVIAFCYNINRLIHESILIENNNGQGIENQTTKNKLTISEKKYLKYLDQRSEKAKKKNRFLSPFYKLIKRMTRLPAAFIRCFKSCFFEKIIFKISWSRLTDVLYIPL